MLRLMGFNTFSQKSKFWKKCFYWLISDLIPKKYEKFEFWKNFETMFLSTKNSQKTKF